MDDLLVAPWERLAKSRAEMARDEGISVRTLQRRLAEERDRVKQFDLADLPYVPVVSTRGAGLHYRTDVDQKSVLPTGLFRINGKAGRNLRIKHAGEGAAVEDTGRKSHKPDPKGLKGGVG